MMRIKLIICTLLISMSTVFSQKDNSWTVLFNGKNLDGWEQKGGKAKFTIEKGVIVGKTVPDSPNSFLCTSKMYDDFILELEFKVDTCMNSGVQFRSLSNPSYKNGVVYGYQMEIDPSKRGWSGGIYDEQGCGWLYNNEYNPKAKLAFKNNQWNKYRIEAIGNHIKTWVNGVFATDLLDDKHITGFIGLQVHSINAVTKPWTLGSKISWKNIRIMTQHLEQNTIKSDKEIVQINNILNTLSDYEQRNGWKLLFDGKTTTGWRGTYKDKFPENGWEIKDGELCVIEADGKESANGGDIVTLDEFADFELVVDFKITTGANSGIKYYVTEKEHNPGSTIGPEFQILDDKNHPDAKLGRDGNRTIGSLYDLIPAIKTKRVNPIGEWNTARIISKNNHVEHWLNGFKVVEYERGSKEFRELVALSKYKIWENFGEAPKGKILLQDHGNKVNFRNIKIRRL